MRNSRKRNVTISVAPSVVIKPTPSDIEAFGQRAYIDAGTHNGQICHMPISFDPSLLADPSLLGPNGQLPLFNKTLAAHIHIASDSDSDNDPVRGDLLFSSEPLLLIVETSTEPEPERVETPTPAAQPIITSAQPPIASEPLASLSTVANDRALARAAAATAVAAFYAGKSLPFKSAHDLKRKSPINFALNRDPSARSAALLAAILTYCDVQPGTLTFVRGSGAVPGRLLGHIGPDADRTYPAGPESGGLSNCIPDRIAFVAGALAGAGCENAVFRINYEAARNNLRAFNTKQSDGEHLFSSALALLDLLHNTPAAEPA